MYETMKRLYTKTEKKTILVNAVAKGYITEEQMYQIILEVDGEESEEESTEETP